MQSVIFGCSGLVLTDEEKRFFESIDPLGFILFARNCESPGQVTTLVEDLRGSVGRDAPVLIDQEGGRVQRLNPPHWRKAPAARQFGGLYAIDPDAAREAVTINSRLIACELKALGVDVDCLPVLDVPIESAHDVIGDRAYGTAPDVVADLGRAAGEGLTVEGVDPVIKHMPGHGRAMVDSHHDLPVVDISLETLEQTDFAPFRSLNDLPWGMTAHVVYTAIDADNPATLSAPVIDRVIRGHIGFQGILMTDDLSMKALHGGLAERTHAAFTAGCDIALHCNGEMAEMVQVADGVGPVTDRVQTLYEERLSRRTGESTTNTDELRIRLGDLLAPAASGV